MPTQAGGKRTNTRQDHRDRDRFKAECKAENRPCWMDGMPIDYEAAWDDWGNGDRFQEDHFYPVSTHPELQHEYWNKRPSHADCNNERSNRAPVATLGTLSREWT